MTKTSKLKELVISDTAQKMRFLVKDFFSKCDQIRQFRHFLCRVSLLTSVHDTQEPLSMHF